MNKDTARDYLPLVQALAEGKTIQVINSDGSWTDLIIFVMMEDASKYRIKPEPKKIHLSIAMHKNGGGHWFVLTNGNDTDRSNQEKFGTFSQWLDHLEYELPEGDA